jgi:uncharacterized protein (DUF362 family)
LPEGGGGPRPDPTNVRRGRGVDGELRARGESVLIKPNLGWDRLPEQAANTDPDVIAELVRQCRAAGASRIVVTDISCNDPRRCFARSGIAGGGGGAVV